MPQPIPAHNGSSGGALDPPPGHVEPHESDLPAEDSTAPPLILRTIADQVQQQAGTWRDALAVGIGRARDLTGLEETRIRYFEDLGALQPAKSTAQAGGSRLYTLSDLRCLAALALLVKQHGYRPAEAAALVKRFRRDIEQGMPGQLHNLLKHEGKAISDGFLLARLMSQILDAVQAELDQARAARVRAVASPDDVPADRAGRARVVGVILPMRAPGADSVAWSPQELQQIGRKWCAAPRDMLVAIDRAAFFKEEQPALMPAALASSGRNDSTILFYSRDQAWALPEQPTHRFCMYVPPARQDLSMMLIVDADAAAEVPEIFAPQPARAALLDRLLRMCKQIFTPFSDSTLAKNYRYRSDGFEIEHTRTAYRELLETIAALVFPGDLESMAALLIPNSLDRPTSLSILADYRYSDALALRAKLDLSGEGQGLCGRAYTLREPFFSADARADPCVAYAPEEHCRVALAVPLVASWGIAPLGVLYLASRSPRQTLSRDDAYFALILGSILGEQLGRWWLTRLRRAHDQQLHAQMDAMVRWFDSLDQHGADFQRALDGLQKLWGQIDRKELPIAESHVALIVFDIDKYRQTVQVRSDVPVPLKAQTHVREAIRKILPDAESYWFKNDHALLVLHNQEADAATTIARRIANQVRAVPPGIQGEDGKPITITVSAAIKIMSYQDLYDLDRCGKESLRRQLTTILDDLRQQTARAPAHSIHQLTLEGWQRI